MAATWIDSSSRLMTPQQLQTARQALLDGKLVIFPTETVYGLGALATHDDGYESLQQVKERPTQQPFAIHVCNLEDAQRYANLSAAPVARLIRRLWPGPLTLVVDVSADEAAQRIKNLGWDARLVDRLYHQGTVGLRCPDHPAAQALLANLPGPVLGTSANRRGQSPPLDAHEAHQEVGEQAAITIDGGRCRYSKPSTVLRISPRKDGQADWKILRPGVYDERFIRKQLRWTLLMVCSGNTCRSPMAEGLARQILARQRKMPVQELENAGVRVLSAGTGAMDGMPASAEAISVMQRAGVDLSSHRSHSLSAQMVEEADVIYCMTRAHLRAVTQQWPATADKAQLLDPQGKDIDDPVGAGLEQYQQCARQIEDYLQIRLQEWQP